MVLDRQTKGGVLIRARAKEDIWNLYRKFKGKYKMTRPKADENRDYRWRIAMKKRDWAKVAYKLAMAISYNNFKDEVHKHPDQDNKHSAYLSIWSTMLRVQHMEDKDHRPNGGQGYFGSYYQGWQREIEFANDRFEAEQPQPIRTIKSVVAENQQKEEQQ